MSKSISSAASQLEGLQLPDGWKVLGQVKRGKNASGGTFSHSYIVEKSGMKGFLKAFDFSDAFEPGQDTISFLQILTAAYEHEREVLKICREKRLSRVVIAIDHGQVQIPKFDQVSGRVFYLIFEMADGDVRGQVDKTARFDTLWSMRALRDVCLGLWQIHKEMIAHQDIKPSNVLIFARDGFRIADFGRCSRKGRSVTHDGYAVAGDRTYAPPELLYGFTHQDFAARRIGCDLYMLGNLAAFMFAGVNVTASIFARLDPKFHPKSWHGSYEQVLPYLQEAFGRLLEEVRDKIDPIATPHVISIIAELCNPNLALRGHPRGLSGLAQYSLERYVSQIVNSCHRVEIQHKARLLAG